MKDGTLIAAAGADKQARLLHGSTGQTSIIGAHAAAVRSIRFVDVPSSPSPVVATGSWDGTVRYWDLRQPGKALAVLNCADRVYSMDTAGRLLVVATAEQHIHLVDLQSNPAKFERTIQSPLKHQTRAVAAFPDGQGWATAGIEGRCAINAVAEKDARCRLPPHNPHHYRRLLNLFQQHQLHLSMPSRSA
jgi:mRNA export factor